MNNNIPIDEISRNLKNAIPKLFGRYHVPGMSLAMFKGKEIVLNLEFGVKNTITREPVDVTTVFEGASFTKPMIAYAALKMCKQGIFELDKPLVSYASHPYNSVPAFFSQVTLRHILQHTSGFPEMMRRDNKDLKMDFQPGSQYGYSNVAFNYLALVMESIIGSSLANYLKNNILVPLQMKNSGFIWEKRYNHQSATPHNRKGQPVDKWRTNQLAGACSLHTTANDFAKFMIEIIQQSKLTNLADSVNMLDEKFKIDDNLSASLGWGIENASDGEVFYHVGDGVTFKSMALAYREQEFGVVFMTNGMNAFKLFEIVLQLSVGGSHRPIVDFEDFETQEEKFKGIDEKNLINWWQLYGP